MFSDREISIWTPPDNVLPSEWAEKFRELSATTSAEAGRMNMNRTPFFKWLMDFCIPNRRIKEISVQSAAQMAKTTTAETIIGYLAHKRPGPAMFFLSDEDTAKEISKTRLIPMFLNTAPLAEMVASTHDITHQKIVLTNGFSLEIAWASSVGKTASRSIRYMFCDEVNKSGYSIKTTGDEGSVLHRISQRTNTFPNRKVIYMSTPTTEFGNITKLMAKSEMLIDWHVPCVYCGDYQILRFKPTKYKDINGNEAMSGGFVWEGGSKATRDAVVDTARYECGGCKAKWTNADKSNAVLHGIPSPRGVWRDNPVSIGLHIPRFYSLLDGGKIENLVWDWIDCQDDITDLKSYVNSVMAEEWVERIKSTTEDEVLASKCELPAYVLPEGTIALTMSVDVQAVGFWFTIRAWAKDKTSWLIGYGYVMTWDEIEKLAFDTDFGEGFGIWRLAIDSGGGIRQDGARSTEEVYGWIVKHQGRGVAIYPTKGASKQLTGKLQLGKPLDKTPSGRPIPRGLRILLLDTNKLKDEFIWRLERARKQLPGAAYLHAETGMDYANQITAEEKRRHGDIERWEQIGNRDNHYFDCAVGHFALASRELMGGVERLGYPAKRSREVIQVSKPKPKEKEARNPYLSGIQNPHLRGR